MYREKARSDILARYSDTIQFRDVGVVKVRKIESDGGKTRFEVQDENDVKYLGRKVVLAMGVRDVMPEKPEGYKDLWGYGMWVFPFSLSLIILFQNFEMGLLT